MRPIDHLMDRLAELAAGAEPADRECGICQEIESSVRGYFWTLLGKSFEKMGLNSGDPLGDYYSPGDMWSGLRGQRRRKLCYDLLVQFIASANYKGKYQ